MTMEIHVSFADAEESAIDGAFYSEQFYDMYPYQGVVASDDPRYVTWYSSLPPMVQQMWPTPEPKLSP